MRSLWSPTCWVPWEPPWGCGHRGLAQEAEPGQTPFSPDYFVFLLPEVPRQWGELMAGLISWVLGMCCKVHQWGCILVHTALSYPPAHPWSWRQEPLWCSELKMLNPVPPPPQRLRAKPSSWEPLCTHSSPKLWGLWGKGWTSRPQREETEAQRWDWLVPTHPPASSRTGGSRAAGRFRQPLV